MLHLRSSRFWNGHYVKNVMIYLLCKFDPTHKVRCNGRRIKRRTYLLSSSPRCGGQKIFDKSPWQLLRIPDNLHRRLSYHENMEISISARVEIQTFSKSIRSFYRWRAFSYRKLNDCVCLQVHIKRAASLIGVQLTL